jgi:hypothetical protein
MLTQSAESRFGSRAAIARALAGHRSVAAVYHWGDVVPLAAARRLAAIDGELVVDESLYDEFGKIIRRQEQATEHVA